MHIVGYVEKNRTSLTPPLPSTKGAYIIQFHIAYEELEGEEEHEFH